MKMVSYSIDGEPGFGLVIGDGIAPLGDRLAGRASGWREVLERGLLPEIRAMEPGLRPSIPLDHARLLPPIPYPGKILCIGVNYANRNEEYKDGAEAPKYPSVFFRTAASFVGHGQPILRPPESEQLDYEGEIVLVIGTAGRRIPEARAESHVAALTIMNEGSIRDWLRHGKFNVTPGKNFDASGAMGPWAVPRDTVGRFDDMRVITRVNGEVRQDDTTDNLMFPFARLVSYISTWTRLEPGDLISTGTPIGAGARFDPPKWLRPGDVVEVEVPDIGTLRNTVEDETA